MNRPALSLFISLIVLFTSQSVGLSEEVNWIDAGDTDLWTNPENWSPKTVPGPQDDAIINGSPPTVNTAAGISANSLELGPDGRIEMQGGGLGISSGSVTNNGQIFIANADNPGASFTFLSDGSLDGTGELVLFNGTRGTPNAILHSNNAAITHGADHIIRGEGHISAHLINNGIIEASDADGENSAVLTLANPNMVNNHIIRAMPSAELDIASSITQGANGRIIADGGLINASTGPPAEIRGGTLETTGGGIIQHGTGFLGLADVVNEGELNLLGVQFGSTTTINEGTLTNNGTIHVNSTNEHQPTTLGFENGTTLAGNGTVVLGKELTSAINGANVVGGVNKTFTHAAEHTIRGEGAISSAMTNHGLIEAADGNGDGTGTLIIRHAFGDDGPIINRGTIAAANGGTLQFNASTLIQEGDGRMVIRNGGSAILGEQVTRITGGVIESHGNGELRVISKAATTLTDVTLDTDVNFDPAFGNSQLVLQGTIANNGTMAAAGGIVRADEALLLTGPGTIELNAAGNASRIETSTGAHITHDVDHTIRGIGTTNADMLNRGTLEGRSGSELLTISNFSRISGAGMLKDVHINGTHAPGEEVAIVDVEGIYQFGGCCFATLEIDVQGSEPGTGHDQVIASGEVNPGAARVQVNFTDGGNGLFMPEDGMQFEILTSANPIEGNFRRVDGSNQGIGGELSLVHEANRVLVHIDDPFLIADFDGDNMVSQGDLDLILLNWGQPAGSVPDTWVTDLPGGNVDQGELDRLLLNWGNLVAPANAALHTGAVPEPATWMIAMLTVCLGVMARTCCRRSTACRTHPC